MIQSKTLIRRGLTIGILVGSIGGLIGALVGQLGYASTSGGGDGSAKRSVFSGEMRERLKEAKAHEGEIEIALIWENRNDLDLHVKDSEGVFINWQNRVSLRTGGELDVDRNAGCQQDITDKPVEHVYWPKGKAPKGSYQVYVDHFANCGRSDPTPFTVEIKVGDSLETFTDSIGYSGAGHLKHIHTFAYSDQPPKQPSGASEFFLWALISRALGWTLFGALVGTAQGLTRNSAQALRNAALGGAIGGLIGGIAFEAIVRILLPLGFTDLMGRLLGFVILGICIGLWIVIIQRALSAILKVRSGRYEGREIYIDRPELRLGRQETLEVYLSGDPDIRGHHATIRQEDASHVISAEQGDVFINDRQVSRQALTDGDVIVICKTRMVYQHRSAGAGEQTPMTPPPSEQRSAAGTKRPVPPPPSPKSNAAESAPQTRQDQPARPEKTGEPSSRKKPPPPPPGKKK